MLVVYAAGIAAVFFAQRGGHAEYFAHHPRCPLDADRSKRHMSHAYVASRHHQVFDVSRVKTALGNCIRLNLQGSGFRAKGLTGAGGLLRIVQVDRPGRGHTGIGKVGPVDDVLLAEDDISYKPA